MGSCRTRAGIPGAKGGCWRGCAASRPELQGQGSSAGRAPQHDHRPLAFTTVAHCCLTHGTGWLAGWLAGVSRPPLPSLSPPEHRARVPPLHTQRLCSPVPLQHRHSSQPAVTGSQMPSHHLFARPLSETTGLRWRGLFKRPRPQSAHPRCCNNSLVHLPTQATSCPQPRSESSKSSSIRPPASCCLSSPTGLPGPGPIANMACATHVAAAWQCLGGSACSRVHLQKRSMRLQEPPRQCLTPSRFNRGRPSLPSPLRRSPHSVCTPGGCDAQPAGRAA